MAKKGLIKIYIGAALLAAVFLPGFVRYQELKEKNAALKIQLEELKRENRRLDEERKRLETDPVYVERKAREKMGFVRKGEIVYKEQ